jgi:hypothetical protein
MKKHLFNSKEAKLIMKKSDDYVIRGMHLNEIYSNVPKKFQKIYIRVMEIQTFECDKKLKKQLEKWLSK